MIHPADLGVREREYSPSSCVASIDPYLQRYATDSERVRADLAWVSHRYGPAPASVLDVFEPSSPAESRDIHLFFHGGYWQQLGRSDASFPAAEFVPSGTTYVAAGYTLAPEATLEQIVAEAQAACRWVRAELLGDGGRLTVSGSSAGAHLAASVALVEPVDRLVLLSGIYDLRPLVGTYVNDALSLSAETAWQLSPIRSIEPLTAVGSVTLAWGEIETDAFKAQSRLFASELASRGVEVTQLEVGGRNHFDIVHDLARLSGGRFDRTLGSD